NGNYNDPAVVTYSFIPTGADMSPIGPNITAQQDVTASAQAFVHTVLELYGNVANLTFSEVTETGTMDGGGDIRIGMGTLADFGLTGQPTLGFAYQPFTGSGSSLSAQDTTNLTNFSYIGDVYLVQDYLGPDAFSAAYGDERNTVSHEIGHALGLDHPFNDNGGSNAGFYPIDSSFTATNYTGSQTGGGHQTDLADTMTETLMTYYNPYRVGDYTFGTSNGLVTAEAITTTPWQPGIQDIAALQHLYGANMTHNAGDDVYTYTTGEIVFENIWDAGGYDIIQHLGSDSANIDLNDGEFSTVGFYGGSSYMITAADFGPGKVFSGFTPAEVSDAIFEMAADGSTITFTLNVSTYGLDDDLVLDLMFTDGTTETMNMTGIMPDRTHMTGNVGIAYGVIIEEAHGGSGADQLLGNEASNTLIGNGGTDVIYGGAGGDFLIGGEGDDFLNGGADIDYFVYDGGVGTNFGSDRILDFVAGTDNLVFDCLTLADLTISIAGSDTLVDLGGGHVITLAGVTTGFSTSDDIIFVT
ncbi:MAG: M10 family metallopeptidase C-terminal domain-containing protein, partial [Pseudomonadota bacterium]